MSTRLVSAGRKPLRVLVTYRSSRFVCRGLAAVHSERNVLLYSAAEEQRLLRHQPEVLV